MAKLARLKSFSRFFPISEYSALRLRQVLGIRNEDIVVTGASVRSSLYTSQRDPCDVQTGEPYFLTVGGGDPRKNTETAVRAVRRFNDRSSKMIGLCVVGHYGTDYKRQLESIASESHRPQFLRFRSGVDDSTLRMLYGGAVATIAPSHIEGFSLPIVGASVCNSPCVSLDLSGHLELVRDTEALFPADDDGELSKRLDRVLHNRELRCHLIRSQAPLANCFHESNVWRAFLGWNT